MGESAHAKYVIVGGGAAAANAAVGIREIDSVGTVLILGQESWWPYDRPPLSKGMLRGTITPEDAESKDPSWYEKNSVEVRRSTKVTSIDKALKTVCLEGGDSVQYEKLLIATGASPRPLGVPGGDLPGVHLLRSIEDSLGIRDAIGTAKTAVLVGAGYIGLEVASVCIGRGVNPTIIDPADHPWAKNTSPLTGNFLKRYFESKGATFRMGEEVAEVFGDGKAQGVALKSGERIEGDLIVAGTGVTLNTELAKAAGFEVDPKNGVVVDERLRTPDQDVYVAGDIADFQDVSIGKRWHAEHFLNARWQGKQAGRNMAGANEVYDKVPYFFSDMLDIHMVLRGDPHGGKSIGALGDPAAAGFVELYAREDGTLAMGIAISRSEPLVDKISDILEKLVRDRAVAKELTEAIFGLSQDGGLG